jgi:DNA-binding PadR family transcriptional regulator
LTDSGQELLKNGLKLIVLAALTDTPKYGYLIIKEIRGISEHFLELREGTLYPILHLLEREGCVKSKWKRSPAGRDRKYYEITRKGRAALGSQKQDWTKMLQAVDAATAGI